MLVPTFALYQAWAYHQVIRRSRETAYVVAVLLLSVVLVYQDA